MAVKQCYICNKDPNARRQYGDEGLAEGEICPVCYQPTCRFHLGTVRWRWRSSGELESAHICKECLRSYRHRDWDKLNRDWIT